MSIPPAIVSAARLGWNWQWNKLMDGLAPSDEAGNYSRPQSIAKNSFSPNKTYLLSRSQEQLPILIIGRSCPWAHRTWLIYVLRNLQRSLNLIISQPDHQAGLWTINSPLINCKSLKEIYRSCGSKPSLRATVPALIEIKDQHKLLGNESAQLVETLNFWPTANNEAPNLFPENLHKEINFWQSLLQNSVNNGVYQCGFARNQSAYEKASSNLFNALNKVEESLSVKGPWLCGEKLTLADIRLFPTMIRWESVYAPLFGCSKKNLAYFPKLMNLRKRFFSIPHVSQTCDSTNWRNDYFGALFPLNPSNIVPNGPSIEEIIKII